ETRVFRSEHLLSSSDWTYAKVRELLLYLLCASSRTKEQIGLALWPDASSTQLRNNLHETLRHLRHSLGRSEWIVYEQQRYAFNRKLPYWFDVEAFEALVEEARHLQGYASAQAISTLEEALSLYQGDFLEDLITGDWAIAPRDELRRRYQEALLFLGQMCFTQGRYAQAADAYRKLITHDRYQEVAHRELMRCYVRLGERGQAFRHSQHLTAWLREELGALPALETQALFERLRRGEES